MNPAALLSLISELYEQAAALKKEVASLKTELNALQKDV